MTERAANLSPLKRAVLALDEMKAKLDALERAKHEPIAIVGIACRFPGGVDDPQSFWLALEAGFDGIVEIPADRWDVDALYDPDPAADGKMTSRWGGFIDGPAEFDAAFFGIAPKEAAAMDPQQRLLLEVAWHAFEDAGQTIESLRDSTTGVFAGVCSSDYLCHQLTAEAPVDAYTTTGNAHSIVANRVSHQFDLRGPSLAIDTACSSSLVAAHLACQSLRAQECSLALAAGVNLILMPTGAISFSRWGMMAPDGRCKAFDARANGFVRGEGCGAVVLKRLSDALRDGDSIVATIVGSATNQDGRSAVLTAPSLAAQRAVIEQALASARRRPGDISYVEAHGTGTALGDPIEVAALAEVLGSTDAASSGCALGSVKTNIGHLEAAAGIAGLIKAALCVHHGRIPPNLHLQTLNPNIDLAGTRLQIRAEGGPWPASVDRRTAGVSSFGFGGANAHAIVEMPPPADAGLIADSGPYLLVLSAKSDAALARLAEQTAGVLSEERCSAGDVCFSAARRTHFERRLAVAGADRASLHRRLAAFVEGQATDVLDAAVSPQRKLAFAFSGQGTQWIGMGTELDVPVFAAALSDCDDALRPYTGWSVIEAMAADPSGLRDTEHAQPAIFALQVALAALWSHWGVVPDVVLGHSVGEIAAAHVAGALSLDDAARLVAARAALMQPAKGAGAMAAVGLDAAAVRALLPTSGALGLAAVNGPKACVVSGETAAVAAFAEAQRSAGVPVRLLDVDYAFHSAQMAPYVAPLIDAASSLGLGDTRVVMYSTVTGAKIDGAGLDATYWGRSIEQPVDFVGAVHSALADGVTDIVEVGGHPALRPALVDNFEAAGYAGLVASSLRRGKPQHESLLTNAGALHCRGYALRFDRLTPPGRKARLPGYPFERTRYWRGGPTRRPATAIDPAWLYRLQWAPRHQPEADSSSGDAEARQRPWLVLADRGGVGTAVADALRRRGHPCEVITGEQAPALKQRLAGIGPTAGVVHLWSLDATTPQQVHALGLAPGIALLVEPTEGGRLWVVTTGAQAAHRNEACDGFGRAALWGLGRVATLEAPRRWGGVIDADGGAEQAETIVRAILDGGADQLALRGDRQLVPRLIRVETPPRLAPPALDADGVYLITGGQGAIGRRLASWLVDRGARHIVLSSRADTAGPPVRALSTSLAERGATLRVIAADVSDPAQVRALIDQLQSPQCKLRGVFHAAGLSAEAALGDVDDDNLRAAMGAKAHGAWHLHESTKALGLDHFVLFSSVASVWGTAHLASYAAANAVLDSLADHRRSLGLPATCLAWGPWKTEGMADADAQDRMAAMGIGAVPVDAALHLLGQAMAEQSSMVVADVDWAKLAPLLESRRPLPLLEDLRPDSTIEAGGGALRATLISAHPAERADMLGAYLSDAVMRVLELGESRRPDPDAGLFDMGMDSLSAVVLKTQLERALGERLPSTLAFEHPTLAALTRHLLADVLDIADGDDSPQEPVARRIEAIEAIEALSEEEARALLQKRRAARGRRKRKNPR